MFQILISYTLAIVISGFGYLSFVLSGFSFSFLCIFLSLPLSRFLSQSCLYVSVSGPRLC